MRTDSRQRLGFIFGRRSIRAYSPGEIPQETVTQLLEAAMAAPSAMTKDPWRFVVVREAATLSAMAEALAGGKMLGTATLAIVVCGDLEAALEQQLGFLLQDCSAAVENLLLAAHALGLGACWVGVYPGEKAVRRMKEILGLPSSLLPMAAIALGLPGEDPGPRTRFNPEYVHFERW